jgi:tRNA A37 threonylcarbamoyladenosine biosynthesis protein TsaE
MLAHVDLYRVRSAQELDDAGFVDLLEPGAVVAVEWADRAPAALPKERLELTLARVPGDPDSRSAAANATGREAQAVLTAWERRLAETDGIELSASARPRSQEDSQPKRPA